MRPSNQKIIKLARFFSDLTPIAPYLALFLISRNLTVSHVATLFSTWAFSTIAFEIPTGVIADYFHKKTLLILSKILKLFCFVIFLLLPNFSGFAAGFILWGLATSLDSGALQALLYETTTDDASLADTREEKEGFSKVYSSAMSWNFAGMIIATICGALLVRFGFPLLIILSISSMAASIILLSLLRPGALSTLPDRSTQDTPKQFRIVLRHTLKNPLVLSPLILGAFVGGIKRSLDELNGLMMSSTGLSLGIIGFVIASFDGMKFLGSRLAAQLTNTTNYQYLFVAVIGLMLMIAGMFGAWIAAIAIALLMVIDACFWIQNDTTLLHAAHEHHRATTLSIKSFFTEISSLGLFTLASFATTIISLSHLYVVLGIAFLLVSSIFFIFSSTNKNTPEVSPWGK